MKRIILATLLVAGACHSAKADDYQYLTVAHSSVEQSIELASIQKITFNTKANQIVVTTTEGETTFPISEMEKMYFSATPTAIKALPNESECLQMTGNQLNVKGNGMLRIYSSNGALQRMAKVEGDTHVDMSNLPKGVYIISLGNQVIKIQK